MLRFNIYLYSCGLSPKLIGVVFNKIIEINRGNGITILIVEQKVKEVLEICEKVYAIKLGRNAFVGGPEELKEGKGKLKRTIRLTTMDYTKKHEIHENKKIF